MTARPVQLRQVRRFRAGRWAAAGTDRLSAEEPLEIRLNGRSLLVLMRTPGEDRELVVGFLLTEGLIRSAEELVEVRPLPHPESPEVENVVEVTVRDGSAAAASRAERTFIATASCGLCGKTTIEALRTVAPPLKGSWEVATRVLLSLPRSLRARQRVFRQTGSLHAAGLFDLDGRLEDIAEDVGRHNAVDKVIGRAGLGGRLPLDRSILMVSGRISFEITQKALMAGIPMVAAVSGASSLAVDLAEDQGMTLVGFVRPGSMTLYHGAWRLRGGLKTQRPVSPP